MFHSNKQDIDEKYLENIEVPQVRPENQIILNSPISIDEIKIAINSLAEQKCPGNDGLSIEWYKKYYEEIKHAYHSVILKNVENGQMHATARDTIISLMDKPN